MNLIRLQLFLTLAEQLHFGRAAERAHVSASTLSRNIQQLEEEVGAQLFERTNRQVALTRHGRQFVPFAQEVIAQWEAYQESVAAQAEVLSGQLSLYCSVTASYSFLYDMLSHFRRQHQGIAIKVHTGDPANALERLINRQEDVAIGAKPEKLPQGVVFKPITHTQLILLTSREKNWPADWASIPFILPEQGIARERINRWFKRDHIAPQVYAEARGNEAIVSMVSLGFGVGIVPAIVVENSLLANRVKPFHLQPDFGPYDIGVFVVEKRLSNPVINAFWQSLQD